MMSAKAALMRGDGMFYANPKIGKWLSAQCANSREAQR